MNESLPEVQLRLAELKQGGAHAVAAIKTIRDEFQLSLGEAKLHFLSPQHGPRSRQPPSNSTSKSSMHCAPKVRTELPRLPAMTGRLQWSSSEEPIEGS